MSPTILTQVKADLMKPNARLKELMPQFKPIPFGKIGLYKDEWR